MWPKSADSNIEFKVAADGTVITIAGNGTAGYSGDGGPAINAQLNGPAALAVDGAGKLYIADSFNGRIRMVSPSGIITTIAGNGGAGYSGDGGVAVNAQFGQISGLAIDSRGNLYAADEYYNTIRLLQPRGSAPVISGVVNAASYVSGAVAPGELVMLNGSGLGSDQLASGAPGSNGAYPTELGGTMVQVNGTPASLIYASATQVAAVIPASVPMGMAVITVKYQGGASSAVTVPVVASSPGIFTADSTGRGYAATIDQNGVTDKPADWGDTITFFATGAGSATTASLIYYPDSPFQQVISLSIDKGGTNSAGVTQFQLPIQFGLDCDIPVRLQVGLGVSQLGVTLAMHVCI
jgi:uncharacterized protein (TIGR03437 family)